MRKHGIDLEDRSLGDGRRTKRLDRKDLDALMGGDGRSGIFTWREKNRRKVKSDCPRAHSIFSSLLFPCDLSVGVLRVGRQDLPISGACC
jgi:hypothetical protein